MSRRAIRSRRTAELLASLAETDDELLRQQLRDEVVTINRPVADALAARYSNRGVPQDDLQQTAYESLTKAVDRFDGSWDRDLLSFAVPTIKGDLRRYFRDLGWTVRPPRRIQELQWQINRATSELAQTLGRDPSAAEIADHLGVCPASYHEAVAAYGSFQPMSLDQPLGEATSAVTGDVLTSIEAGFDVVETREALWRAMKTLSPRERHIVYQRYWLDRTQREIGAGLGITQMQVSRLLAKIFQRLRDHLDDTDPDPDPGLPHGTP